MSAGGDAVGAALGAAPEASSWREVLAFLDRRLRSGGTLAIVGAGRLAGLTHWLRPDPGPGVPRWFMGRAGGLVGELQNRRFTVTHFVGFGSLRSLWWATASRMAGAVGRSDLTDRYEAGFRASLVCAAPPAAGALLVLALCRKETHQ